ncbi:MAG: hypothetical protein R3290_05715 [Acidimicrobiia bacterium]|nr:hypothetical protein [Acidimicrobiia bacterium]
MTVHSIPAHARPDARPDAEVTVDADGPVVEHLRVADRAVVALLRRHDPGDHAAVLTRALAVGARGLLTMGTGLDVAAVDEQVRATLGAVADEAEERVSRLLEEGAAAFSEGFDPTRRTSHVARALEEFGGWRDEFLARLDPDRADSHATSLLDRMTGLLGPDGLLERRLRAALDPEADGSAFGRLQDTLERGFTELRDLIVEDRGRAAGREAEAAVGTRQGFDFEDVVEERLRGCARSLGGAVVERVSTTPGDLGPKRTVGDFVVELDGGERIVVEAKHQATLTLAGRDGVLAELDDAMANRGARIAVCVAGKDAFPAEVGRFGVFGDRILVVDDGEGTMLDVALRWAAASARLAGEREGPELDTAAVADRIQRIRKLAERFKTNQRSLTEIGKSVETVRLGLAGMRTDLLELVDDLARELGRTG